MNSYIYPVSFTDHHLVTLDFHISPTTKYSSYWHFNVKLLKDSDFSQKCETSWGIWRERKREFESLSQWWEEGKAHIQIFCQQYTSHSTVILKRVIRDLEEEIRGLENSLLTHSSTDSDRLQQKKQELGSFLRKRVKGALVRSRFTSVRDMDAPTSFFFNLKKSVSRTKQMVCLRLPDGTLTTDPAR